MSPASARPAAPAQSSAAAAAAAARPSLARMESPSHGL
jgi:hypothetical protein